MTKRHFSNPLVYWYARYWGMWRKSTDWIFVYWLWTAFNMINPMINNILILICIRNSMDVVIISDISRMILAFGINMLTTVCGCLWLVYENDYRRIFVQAVRGDHILENDHPLVRNSVKWADYYSYIYTVFIHSHIIILTLPTIYGLLIGTDLSNMELPYKMWLPFDPNGSWWIHILVMLQQVYCFWLMIPGHFVTDWLSTKLLLFVRGHFLVLIEKIDQWDPTAINCKESLKRIHTYYLDIWRLTVEIQSIYCIVALGKFFISAAIVTFSLFSAMYQPLEAALPELIAAMGTLLNFLFHSIIGEECNLLFQEISFKFYDRSWYLATIEIRKYIILSLTRFNITFQFTIGKVWPLRMATFVSLVKTIYSSLMLIRQVTETE